MTELNDIISEILIREGGGKYTNDPKDRGGPTKWGITQKAWGDYIDRPATIGDIKSITEETAYDFYREEYVFKPKFHMINNENLRELVIDCGVNHGTSRAAKWIQRAAMVKKDGLLGPISLKAINMAQPLELYLETTAYRIRLYGRIVSRDRSQARFISGWNNRVAMFLEEAGQRIAEGLPAV
jgi:lysozyme family protein